jgi:hypothetical protein
MELHQSCLFAHRQPAKQHPGTTQILHVKERMIESKRINGDSKNGQSKSRSTLMVTTRKHSDENNAQIPTHLCLGILVQKGSIAAGCARVVRIAGRRQAQVFANGIDELITQHPMLADQNNFGCVAIKGSVVRHL